MIKLNFTKKTTKGFKVIVLIILASLFVECHQKEKHNNVAKENWEIVKNSVSNATELSSKRSDLLNEIYRDLSPENKQNNLEKLEKVKSLSIEIGNRIKANNEILFTQYVKQNKPEIFEIGLNYINSSAPLEQLLPIFYEKAKKDIMGQQTETNEAILNAVEHVISETEKYQDLMNKYREKHNLDVPKIYIPTQSTREKLNNTRKD